MKRYKGNATNAALLTLLSLVVVFIVTAGLFTWIGESSFRKNAVLRGYFKQGAKPYKVTYYGMTDYNIPQESKNELQ